MRRPHHRCLRRLQSLRRCRLARHPDRYDVRGHVRHGGGGASRSPRLRRRHPRHETNLTGKTCCLTSRSRRTCSAVARARPNPQPMLRACGNENAWSLASSPLPRRTLALPRVLRREDLQERKPCGRHAPASLVPGPAPEKTRRWMMGRFLRSQRVPHRRGTVHTQFPAFSSVVTRSDGSLVVAAVNSGGGAWR